MLIESLVKATVELQGFRVVSVTEDTKGLVAAMSPDHRYALRCGQCHERAPYRDTREPDAFVTCRCGGSQWSFSMRRGG